MLNPFSRCGFSALIRVFSPNFFTTPRLVVLSLGCSALDQDWFYHSAATRRSPLAHHGNSLSHLIRYLIHNKSILISFMFGGLAAAQPPSCHHPHLFSARQSSAHLISVNLLIIKCGLLTVGGRGRSCVCRRLLYQGRVSFSFLCLF